MMIELTKKEQKMLMTPEERFSLDCKEIIRPELAKILTTPLRGRQCIDQGLAENWYRMMFEPYIRKLGALVGCGMYIFFYRPESTSFSLETQSRCDGSGECTTDLVSRCF